MDERDRPSPETSTTGRTGISWKAVRITLLLVGIATVVALTFIFRLYGLSFVVIMITITTFFYAIKSNVWSGNLRKWYEEDHRE